MKDAQTKIFIGIEILLWIGFLVLDILNLPTTYIKYSGILLCFLYASIQKKWDLSVAFFFTLLADWFLLIVNKHYALGLFFFLIVQIVYAIILKENEVELRIGWRILLAFLLIIVLNILQISNLTTNLSVLYFSQLFINCLTSYTNKKLRLFSVGLSLFVCCDLCVGLHNVFIYSFIVAWLQWFWYLPSQVIIALSTLK